MKILLIVGVVLLCGDTGTLIAQSPCLPMDSSTTFIQSQLVHLTSAVDTGSIRARNSVGLPALLSSDVQFVTDSSTCASAAATLAADTPGGDAHPAAWVFRMGPARYVAYNGRQKVHGNGFLYVLDSTFSQLASFPF